MLVKNSTLKLQETEKHSVENLIELLKQFVRNQSLSDVMMSKGLWFTTNSKQAFMFSILTFPALVSQTFKTTFFIHFRNSHKTTSCKEENKLAARIKFVQFHLFQQYLQFLGGLTKYLPSVLSVSIFSMIINFINLNRFTSNSIEHFVNKKIFHTRQLVSLCK